jgi:hypothetical protein
MEPSVPRRRAAGLAALLVLVSAASAALAFAVAPRAQVTAATLDTSGVRTRGAPPIVRQVEYEWPRELREAETATLAVRFRDPACAGKGAQAGAGERQGVAGLEVRSDELEVTLVATGFRYATSPRRIRLQECVQVVGWDVTPERAAQHRLSFKFANSIGDVEVSPSRFDVAVAGPLLLSSSTLYHGASAFSVVTAALGVGTAVGKLRRLADGVRNVLRRGKA